MPVESRKTIGALEWALDSCKAPGVWAGNHSWVFCKCVDSQRLSHLPSPTLCFLTDSPDPASCTTFVEPFQNNALCFCLSPHPFLSPFLLHPTMLSSSALPFLSLVLVWVVPSVCFLFFLFFLPYSNFCFPVCAEQWHREYPPWSRPELVSQSTKGRVTASCCLQASALLLLWCPT